MSCFYRVLKVIHWALSNLCPQERRYGQIPTTKLPWSWVGTKIHDEYVTVTEVVNQALRYNVRITPQLLREITGYDTVEWKYLDTETLQEKDFPSSGIVIENAP